MAKALITCAIGIWLSTAVPDVANAVGTFRLTGPWLERIRANKTFTDAAAIGRRIAHSTSTRIKSA